MSQIFEVEAIYGVPRNTTEPSHISPLSTDREQSVVARTQVEVIQGTLHRHVKAPNVIVESEVNIGAKVDFHAPPFTTMVLQYEVPSNLRGYLNPIIAVSEVGREVGIHTKAIFGDTFVRQRLFRKVSSWLRTEASAHVTGGREPRSVMYLTYRPPVVILNVDCTFRVQKIVAEAELILVSQGGYVNAITTEVDPWFKKNYNREVESYVDDVVADMEREALTHQYTEFHTETIHASAELTFDSSAYVSAISTPVEVETESNKSRTTFIAQILAENDREKVEATRTINAYVGKITGEASLIFEAEDSYVENLESELAKNIEANRTVESNVDNIESVLQYRRRFGRINELTVGKITGEASLILEAEDSYVDSIQTIVEKVTEAERQVTSSVDKIESVYRRRYGRINETDVGKITGEASLIFEAENSYVDNIQTVVEKVTGAERQVISSVEKIESTLHHRRRYWRINEIGVGKIETQAEWFIERVAHLSRLTTFAQGRQSKAGRQPTSYVTLDASVRVDIHTVGDGRRIVTRALIVNPIYAEAYPEAEVSSNVGAVTVEAYPEAEVSSNVGAVTVELEIEIHTKKELEETPESYVGRIHTDVTRFIRIRDSIGPRERTICELLYERLPAIYRTKDAELGFPLRRFLLIMCQGGFGPLKEDIDRFTDLFDVDSVPAEYLDFLAQKVGFEFPPGDLTTTEKRKFVKLAPFLYERKGTKSGLAYFFSELTGYRVTITEDYASVFVTNESPVGHYHDPGNPGVDLNHRVFHPSMRSSVTVWLGYTQPIADVEEKQRQLQWIADRYVPAGVNVSLRLYKIEEPQEAEV